MRRSLLAAGLLAMLAFGSTLGVLGAYLYLSPNLPDVETIKDIRLQVPLRVYSRDGRLIAQIGEYRRIPVRFEAIPGGLVEAFLAAEDDRFFDHPGVDYQGLVRAALVGLATMEARQGGSTITMQLARNYYLTPEKSIRRKLLEIFLALRIERELSKHDILTLYLNKIFLGQRAYGVAAAAEVYYGKALPELTLAEMATIAGLPKAPSRLNPVSDPAAARQRRDYVLRRMLELGFIDAIAYQQAVAAPAATQLHGPTVEVQAPYVAEMVRAELLERLGRDVYTAGYRVKTTVDSRLQVVAVRSLRQALLDYDRRHGYRGALARLDWPLPGGPAEWAEAIAQYPGVGSLEVGLVVGVGDQQAEVFLAEHGTVNIGWDGLKWAKRFIADNETGPAPARASDVVAAGEVVYLEPLGPGAWALAEVPDAQAAIVALDPQDGAIVALSGGFDFFASKYNRAVQAQRQPGSSFKPFIYSAALDRGLTPATVILDSPVVFEDTALETTWRPENYSGEFYGPTRLREGLVKSRNLVSVRILRETGIGFALRYLQGFGFTRSGLPRDLSLALGSANLSPLQMASAYVTFANGGYLTPPYFIERIEDAAGRLVYHAEPAYACAACEAALESLDRSLEEQRNRSEPLLVRSAEASGPPPATAAGEPLAQHALEYLRSAPLAERTISAANAWLITDMMKDVIRRGTGRRALALGRSDLAGKTGTTNDRRDAWFSGFNEALVVTTWIGFDQERSLGAREEGGRTALPMWMYFMQEALAGTPERAMAEPPGLVTARISPSTGELVPVDAAGSIVEKFIAGHMPKTAETGSYPVYGPDEEEDDDEPLF